MGEVSITTGRIHSMRESDHHHNLKIIESLPSQNSGYKLFTSEMFTRDQLSGKGEYVLGFFPYLQECRA